MVPVLLLLSAVPARAEIPLPPPWAGEPPEPGVVAPDVAGARTGASGLALPRFASLRSAEINLRAGPGSQFPVNWTYRRRALPVQILAEFENWRRIRDFEGITGWAHRATLSARRTVVVTGGEKLLRAEPGENARPVARLEPGVILELRQCEAGKPWCRVSVGGVSGWLKRSDGWGVLEDETVE